MRVRISWPSGETTGVLEDTPTAGKLADALPVTSEASTWGDEVYFEVPVSSELDANPKQVVDRGTPALGELKVPQATAHAIHLVATGDVHHESRLFGRLDPPIDNVLHRTPVV